MNKKEWILNYINENGPTDMLNEMFVSLFIKEFDAKHEPTLYGAFKCKELSKTLSDLYKEGFLSRGTIGIGGGEGLPKWIYTYDITYSGQNHLTANSIK